MILDLLGDSQKSILISLENLANQINLGVSFHSNINGNRFARSVRVLFNHVFLFLILKWILKLQRLFNGTTLTDYEEHSQETHSSSSRVTCMDTIRGMTCALMILVDDVDETYKRLHHSPCHGHNVADLVTPWVLVLV